MSDSNNKRKRLREWSIDELQEELRKRQCRVDEGKPRSRSQLSTTVEEDQQISNDNVLVPYGPDASSVSLMVAIANLSRLFENLVHKRQRYSNQRNYVFPFEHASFLLKAHPSIVGEAFRKRTVLSYFIQAKAPLDAVKEICQMYKRNNLSTGQGSGISYNFHRAPNPIGDLCLYGPGADGVLEYVTTEFADQILQRDRQNRLPIELFLLRILSEKPDGEFSDLSESIPRKHSYPILECLFSHCPNMLEYCRNGSMYMSKILDNYSIPHETKLVLSEKFARGCHVDSIVLTKRVGTVSVPEAMAISKFLPSLKVCSVLPKDMYDDAARVFISSLYSMDCSNLVELGLPLNPSYHPNRDDSGGRFLTLRAIRNCQSLKKLSLQVVGSSYESKKSDTCMNLCNEIVKENPGIESLELRNFRLKNSASMSSFFAGLKNVKDLVMENFRIDTTRWCMSNIPANAKLESFRLQADLKADWSTGLLLQLVEEIPTLKALRLNHWKRTNGDDNNEVINLTSVLESVLSINRIQLFRVPAVCTLDMNRICNALKTNTKLERLEMPACNTLPCQKLADTLELHNTTLRHIEAKLPQESPSPARAAYREDYGGDIILELMSSDEDSDVSYGRISPFRRRLNAARARNQAQVTASEETEQQRISKKIFYFVMLNRFGRGMAQDAKITTAALVDLLCKVANEPSFEVDLMMRHNIQFGLLLSAPNIWAGAK